MDRYKIDEDVEINCLCHMCGDDSLASNVFVGYEEEYDFFIYACDYHTKVLKDQAEKENAIRID